MPPSPALPPSPATEESFDYDRHGSASTILATRLPFGGAEPSEQALEERPDRALGESKPVVNALASDRKPPSNRVPQSMVRSQWVILVVDDDQENAEIVGLCLAKHGYRTLTANRGAQALELLTTQCVDLVLLDVVMPDLSGREVLQKIRSTKNPSELPVIMTTALGGSDDVVAALTLGANDYVTKPLDFDVVLARITAQLRVKETQERVRHLHLAFERAQQTLANLTRDGGSWDNRRDDVWTRQVVSELRDILPDVEVCLWSVAESAARLQAGSDRLEPPSHSHLKALERTATPLLRKEIALFPIIGSRCILQWVLGVDLSKLEHRDVTLRLIAAFVRQLGNLVELRETHNHIVSSGSYSIGHPSQQVGGMMLCSTCGSCYPNGTIECAEDSLPLIAPKAPIPLLVADRYRLLRRVGEGGMGTVFKAQDERLDRQIAIKLLHPESSANANLRARFHEEARMVAQLDNPGIVEIHDYGEAEFDTLFIVMEWLAGFDLAALIKRQGPGSPTQVAELLLQAAQALDHAHAAGVVHRDIKPANIFLTASADGLLSTKLLDFGVARDVRRGDALTLPGSIIGTLQYMAPEQVLNSDVGPRSDLYSLAVVAFEALTGKPPRAGGLSTLALTRPPVPTLSSLFGEVPEGLEQAFASALVADPEARPKSARQWLAGFIDDLPRLPPLGRWETAGWDT